ncbi:MAG: oligoendopeptidase F, partial [Nitrospira sp. WS110]|nr:oligoendopeptidase F [Nitrospira sp. WS110]
MAAQRQPRQPRRKTSAPIAHNRWDLSDLVKKPPIDVERSLVELGKLVGQVESARPQLQATMSSPDFLAILRLTESIAEISNRLGAFAYLWFSENTKEAKSRSLKSRVEERLTALNNRLLFFDLWWQGVDSFNAERLMADAGDLRYHLETIRRYKSHTLSEAEEKIMNVKNVTGRSAVNTLYDVVTNGLTFTLMVDGKKRTMNREQLMTHVRSPQASIRQTAYQELYRVFSAHRDLIGEMYRTLVNDWKSENVELRAFSSPIATR